MTQNLNESKEWVDAGVALVELTNYHLSNGSTGIAAFCEKVLPVWNRYNAGERTDELLRLIQSIIPSKDTL